MAEEASLEKILPRVTKVYGNPFEGLIIVPVMDIKEQAQKKKLSEAARGWLNDFLSVMSPAGDQEPAIYLTDFDIKKKLLSGKHEGEICFQFGNNVAEFELVPNGQTQPSLIRLDAKPAKSYQSPQINEQVRELDAKWQQLGEKDRRFIIESLLVTVPEKK